MISHNNQIWCSMHIAHTYTVDVPNMPKFSSEDRCEAAKSRTSAELSPVIRLIVERGGGQKGEHIVQENENLIKLSSHE